MDDDEDDIVVLPLSKYTKLKERSREENESKRNTTNMLSSNFERNIETTEPKISVDLSNSELTDVSDSCRKTLAKLMSSVVNLEASSSKPFGQSTCPQSIPSSPDSDSELLKPAFEYNKNDNSSVKITSKGVNNNDLPVPKDCIPEVSSKNIFLNGMSCSGMGARTTVKGLPKPGLGKCLEVMDKDDCLEEPVKKKKRTKEEIEEKKQEAMVGDVGKWDEIFKISPDVKEP